MSTYISIQPSSVSPLTVVNPDGSIATEYTTTPPGTPAPVPNPNAVEINSMFGDGSPEVTFSPTVAINPETITNIIEWFPPSQQLKQIQLFLEGPDGGYKVPAESYWIYDNKKLVSYVNPDGTVRLVYVDGSGWSGAPDLGVAGLHVDTQGNIFFYTSSGWPGYVNPLTAEWTTPGGTYSSPEWTLVNGTSPDWWNGGMADDPATWRYLLNNATPESPTPTTPNDLFNAGYTPPSGYSPSGGWADPVEATAPTESISGTPSVEAGTYGDTDFNLSGQIKIVGTLHDIFGSISSSGAFSGGGLSAFLQGDTSAPGGIGSTMILASNTEFPPEDTAPTISPIGSGTTNPTEVSKPAPGTSIIKYSASASNPIDTVQVNSVFFKPVNNPSAVQLILNSPQTKYNVKELDVNLLLQWTRI